MTAEPSLLAMRRRVMEARARLQALPEAGAGVLGPPDPATGERWDRGNVLGHMANILPFWTGQVEGVLTGGTWVGRGKTGYVQRKEAIEAGRHRRESELRAEIERGIAGLLALLERIEPDDLARTVEHRRAAEARIKTLEQVLDDTLVRHLEAHVRQLEEVTALSAEGPEDGA